MSDWDKDELGLKVFPVMDWETAHASRVMGFVRFRYGEDEENYQAGGKAIQLAFSATQLRLLAQDALSMAEFLDGTKTVN